MNHPVADADANVEIINELKKILENITQNASARKAYTFSANAFQRKRVLTFSCVVLLIVHALKRTLSIELATFFTRLSTGKSCSKQAFCEQRAKLSPVFFP